MRTKNKSDSGTRRISHKEAFELCYLRHQYLRRVKYTPSREEMEPYSKIIEKFTRSTFYTYKNLFLLIGLDFEDILSSARVQLVSFLGLYALERNSEKLANFKRNFRSHNSIICKKHDILNKNQANFTCFLKQRMEDMVRVCRQKAKNIKGFPAEEFLVFKGDRLPPVDHEDLLANPHDYGYKSIGIAAFKAVKKKFKNNQIGPVFLDENEWYVCVPVRKKSLSIADFRCNNQNPYDNLHNMTPEEYLDNSEKESFFENKLSQFKNYTDTEKATVIKIFLDENSSNITFKEEVDIARSYLERLNVSHV